MAGVTDTAAPLVDPVLPPPSPGVSGSSPCPSSGTDALGRQGRLSALLAVSQRVAFGGYRTRCASGPARRPSVPRVPGSG
jgi:hypothetical protein